MPPIEAPPTGPVPITGPAVPALAPVEAPGPQAPPPGPARLADPLLGANPPIMPDMEAPVARPSPTAPGTKPAAPKAATADVMPPLEAAPLPAPVPAAPPPGELPPVVLPPAEAPPPVAPVPSLPAPQAAREGGAKRDSDLVRTGADPTAVPSSVTLRSDIKTPRMQPASEIAARVGDEVITMTELTSAMKERGRKQLAGQKLTREDVQMLASFTLNDLVDRSLVMQEAKRKLKDPKKYQTVVDAADNVFKEHEVPALMRKYRVDTERALRDALIADDSSYERARENFRYRFITGGYIEQQLSTKFKVDLPEKRAYYNEHLNEFNRPAQITWREVVVEVRKARSRTEAYHRAEAILARLRRGEDFAKVAATESDGPTKNAGGRWQTRPGGYAVSSVNRALEGLPVGQVSPIIEGPDSYHIVMVEERREAGPARFDEVQDEIQDAVAREKSDRITSQFIEKLRRQTYVWTRYAGTPNDPEVLRAKYAKARAGSR
ncbi:MAG: peptidylprolyl isomerase [Isosphaeraceae bacterium]|nr:peptidylprolyl isomerase [Isosphaeraceae bacterium]